MAIRVQAVFPNGGFGFDGQGRRRDGDVFSIDESLFDANWMVEVVEAPEQAPEGAENKKPKKRSVKGSKVG